jgi:hypothetical protein
LISHLRTSLTWLKDDLLTPLEQWLKRGVRFRKKGLFQLKNRKALFLQCHIVALTVNNILCFYGFCLRKKRNELILTRKENEAVMLWDYLRKNILPKTLDTIM